MAVQGEGRRQKDLLLEDGGEELVQQRGRGVHAAVDHTVHTPHASCFTVQKHCGVVWEGVVWCGRV